MTDSTTAAERRAQRAAATAERQAKRAAEHELYLAQAAARRAAERVRRIGEQGRTRAKRTHDALMRRVFGLRRDFTSAPLETEDGTPFISLEFFSEPGEAPSLFVQQHDPDSGRHVVIRSRTGVVVASASNREAALRAFAKTLPAVVVMPPVASDDWPRAWRSLVDRRRARHATLVAD